VDVVRVLRRINAAGAEPDLTFLDINAVDATDEPIAFGDLIFHRAGGLINQIEMVPAIAFRHPNDLAGRFDLLLVELAAVVDESLAGFIDDGAGRARLAIDADDAQRLMAALIVKEDKLLAGFVPMKIADAPGTVE